MRYGMPINIDQRCARCGTVFLSEAKGEMCALCLAYESGEMILREGMTFNVTAAHFTHLQNWLSGVLIPSRILESHPTYGGARGRVARLNPQAPGNEEEFYFVTSSRALLV